MGSYVNILGIDFSKLNLKETVELIDTKISEGSNRIFHLITVNPEIAVQIQEDPELKKISLGADLITPDGVGIVWASRLKGNPVPERVTGYDLLLETIKVGNQKGWSFYLLGSDEEVNMKASENIRISNPDILIVALGSPLADKWIYSHKNDINPKVVFGVGGSLDVIAGKVKRTPEILKKLNLEWLHRRITQPLCRVLKYV
ncbi:acetylglucosaminyldiphosphoundecaprenol acetyl-beta-D-mannosaminyltransferase [Clostridium beijerinckii]|uniref:WecB/TagA/CpsF family glycosyltransferase n=1 Tax=Clostridium beijerinckii TaxID=1520 RepID=A0AB74VAU5_CLOBE|nr:WecB/TagA/CpsF family glycosyltransferase [Clostridium beijerinckii]NRZ27789.1 N-acetylglucosaminyldiphosphoundecaprenol N-acetyl-beta-D-mannosaminyltransferase [Clostridium beijerinckii]NYB96431.1 N-acetylglucosaminyldiphosphoundecaprenol N-acetyl-beta-D-mannosaminyltransferase [Clostridium beijerinckii]OOM21676.1 putative N-acetylmannosaminyltransferase [Clostridium beijerinckii]QUN33566.1 WecB/TagA/CpsF family glycosyltransferase [Clostridium beijerinckii]SQB01361.1 WecB/TagA/CpsF family